MSWITLTVDDLATRFTAPELDALREQFLANGDPTDEVLASTAEEVRGYVAACERNRLGEAGAIPSRLKTAALAVAAYNLALRVPVPVFDTEARRKVYEDAVTLLKSVAACKYSVDAPEIPESPASSSPPPRPSIRPKCRKPL